jgi:hypothetical protein
MQSRRSLREDAFSLPSPSLSGWNELRELVAQPGSLFL